MFARMLFKAHQSPSELPIRKRLLNHTVCYLVCFSRSGVSYTLLELPLLDVKVFTLKLLVAYDLVHFWSFKGDCPPAFVLVHSLAVAKEAVHDYRVALRDGHPVRYRSLRESLWLDAQCSSSGRLVSLTRK